MSGKQNEQNHILQLEEEITSLTEELSQCQADKEFVWSLWKRLQVENPDLTQAISLVVDREKHKAEAKDRKVLEILQVKDGKLQELEQNLDDDLKEARSQMEVMHGKINGLASQVAVKQTELAQKEVDVTRSRQELQELQNLYKQSNAHAAQQVELIQQLQALNMDTQKVLRSQEDAHTTETISYQKLYNDLNACYETVKSSETRLRQNNIALTDQLHQKAQQISQLQGALDALPKPPQELKDVEQPSLIELELIIASQRSEINFLQAKVKMADLQLTQVNKCGSGALENSILRAGRKHEVPPVKRSRSLSPKGFSRESEELRKLRIAEKNNEDLEKALQVKNQENAEIRKAHERRRERLLTLQTNYRAVKQQIEQCDDACGKEKGNNKRPRRADHWQLRQEDSDAVWNELAHFKREHRKLLAEKMNLEEEMDQLKVQASTDKATIQELNVCLQQEREELLFRLGKDEEVWSSTPKKNAEETLQRTLQKVSCLEKRLSELEMESRKLRRSNDELSKERTSLKASLRQHRKDAETREQKMEQLIVGNLEANQAREAFEVKKDELNREITSLKRLLAEGNKLRNENRDLLRQVQSLQHALDKAKAVANLATRERIGQQGNKKGAETKVKLKAAKKISLRRHQAFLNQSIKVMSSMFENFSKDGWEDVSEDSDSETASFGSLGDVIVKSTQTVCLSTEETSTAAESTSDEYTETVWKEGVRSVFPNGQGNLHGRESVKTTQTKKYHPVLKLHKSTVKGVRREKRNKIVAFKHGISLASLRKRVASLQHQVAVLQKGKQAATAFANELKKAKIKLAAELHLAHQRLQISKQMAKKLSSDLAEFQREKEYLERAAEQMREQLAQAKRSSEMQSPMTSDQSTVTTLTPSKSADFEMKQLQSKLKNMTIEMAKQSSMMKSLRNEVQEKDDRIRELQERVARMERDVNMKRHLIEDLRTRLKTYQENERPSREMLESLESKVKALTEECSHKKTSIDSLKQRLNVATKEKAQYEQMYCKVREGLEKKNLKVTDLESKVTEAESAMSELETTASQQLHGLAVQSEQALEVMQNKLLHANRRADELVTFVKSLAKELQLNICDIRSQIRQRRIMQESNKGPSKESVHRAQSLAASILNISRTDLDEILDVQDEEEMANVKRSVECDKEWMNHVTKLLEGQFPFASGLMEAVLDKLNQKKKLVEEYTLLKRDTS
ncbi:centlein isoform X2 [Ascaphus truei]|uniref:centlein isoform X2 n=1 Tax=Ascaphus truei TaxID=8439 RepID=UPI003F5A3FEC